MSVANDPRPEDAPLHRQAELPEFFAAAGLELIGVIPTASHNSMVEGMPA